jgi:predicted MFS family arabinose efflux permease
VVLEVPTGLLADRIGRRTSLLAGAVMCVLGECVYASGHSFGVFLAGEIILALGMTFTSGADAALLFDTLSALGRRDEFQRHEGRARAVQMVAVAVCSVVGGVVGAHSTRATLWMSAAGSVVALVFAGLLVVPASTKPAAERPASALSLLADTLRFLRKHRLVRWYVMFSAVLSGSATWLLWLYQPYLQWTGLPVWSFGLIFALFNLGAAAASQLSARYDQRTGPTGALLGLAAMQVLPLLPMALVPAGGTFLFILLHQAVRGILRPLVADRVLAYTFADKRATVLSVASLGGRLFFAATGPLVGWWAKVLPMGQGLLCQAGLLAAVLGLLAIDYARIPAKYRLVKDSVRGRQ